MKIGLQRGQHMDLENTRLNNTWEIRMEIYLKKKKGKERDELSFTALSAKDFVLHCRESVNLLVEESDSSDDSSHSNTL